MNISQLKCDAKGPHLSAGDGELLLTLLALSSLIIFKPGVALTGAINIQDMTSEGLKQSINRTGAPFFTFQNYLQSLVDFLEVFHLELGPFK